MVNYPQPHSAIWCAVEMAHVHNCFIRSLNAIVQQAPHIPDASKPHYAQDVKDLLYFVESWSRLIGHHHENEETNIFPLIEELAGHTGVVSGAKDQHERLHDGLIKLQEYASRTQATPEEYRWESLKGLIDALAPALIEHLTEEIDILLSLRTLDDAKLLQSFKKSEVAAQKAARQLSLLYVLVPLLLGNSDKTFEGGNEFPPLPGVMSYAVKYWFSKEHQGAWRFNSCDYWGKPVPLQMLPENKQR